MPNDQTIDFDWPKYRVSIREVEKLTGYTFFRNIPEDVAEVIKERVDTIAVHVPRSKFGAGLRWPVCRSHAPRGNARFDAPRRVYLRAGALWFHSTPARPRIRDAERRSVRSHAERGNEDVFSEPLLYTFAFALLFPAVRYNVNRSSQVLSQNSDWRLYHGRSRYLACAD